MTPTILLTVAMSGIAAGFAAYFITISKERLWFFGRKTEELYCTVEALDCELSGFYSQCLLLGEVQPTRDPQALARAKAYLATSQMLIGLYFPTLSHDLARATAAAATAQHSLEILDRGASESGRIALAEALDDAVCNLKDSLEALKGAILSKAQIARNRRFLWLWSRSRTATPKGRILQVHA